MAKTFRIIESDATDKRVPLPEAGLPPQRLWPSVRLLLQLTVFPFMVLDLASQRLLRAIVRPPYKRHGQCQKSGRCCRYLAQHQSGLHRWRFFHWWVTEVNGFYERSFEVEPEEGGAVRIYSCRHLTAEGTCSNYALRPAVCRTWPRIDYFGPPSIMKGCGYSFEYRNGKTQ